MLADGTWVESHSHSAVWVVLDGLGGDQQLEVYDVSSARRRPGTGRRVASSICAVERDAPGGFLAYRSTEHAG